MTTTPYDVFIDFVQCEDQLAAFVREKERAERDIKTFSQEKQTQKIALEKLREKLTELQKALVTHETEVASSRLKKSDTERKMDRITNPRELASLQHELTALVESIEKNETAVVQLWEAIEAEQVAVKTAEQILQQKIQEIGQREQALHDRIKTVQEFLVEQQKMCDLRSAIVRPEWLEKYRSLKTQTHNPVVAVVDGGCSGCFSKIPPQIIARVERHELVPCPLCRRLLYYV